MWNFGVAYAAISILGGTPWHLRTSKTTWRDHPHLPVILPFLLAAVAAVAHLPAKVAALS